jgi:hypothetical protein
MPNERPDVQTVMLRTRRLEEVVPRAALESPRTTKGEHSWDKYDFSGH